MIKVFKKYQKLFFNMAISITICLLAINISAPAQSYNRAPKINIAVLYHLWIFWVCGRTPRWCPSTNHLGLL